jgi:hypothetical protein
MNRISILLILTGVLYGCGATVAQLKTRAAFDLKCPEASIQITKIDSRTNGVSGCGQQATYVESCAKPNGTDCTWILNTDSSKQ